GKMSIDQCPEMHTIPKRLLDLESRVRTGSDQGPHRLGANPDDGFGKGIEIQLPVERRKLEPQRRSSNGRQLEISKVRAEEECGSSAGTQTFEPFEGGP